MLMMGMELTILFWWVRIHWIHNTNIYIYLFGGSKARKLFFLIYIGKYKGNQSYWGSKHWYPESCGVYLLLSYQSLKIPEYENRLSLTILNPRRSVPNTLQIRTTVRVFLQVSSWYLREKLCPWNSFWLLLVNST